MSYDALPVDQAEEKPASTFTQDMQEKVLRSLPFDDRRSFENASKGFIATLDPLTITRPDGSAVLDLSKFDFLNNNEAPPTVNPSLWRQAQLTAQHTGLFEVVEGIYQVRAFDIANMTLIQGETGWIIVDPLTSSESSRAALELANEKIGHREVVAVIPVSYTHLTLPTKRIV